MGESLLDEAMEKLKDKLSPKEARIFEELGFGEKDESIVDQARRRDSFSRQNEGLLQEGLLQNDSVDRLGGPSTADPDVLNQAAGYGSGESEPVKREKNLKALRDAMRGPAAQPRGEGQVMRGNLDDSAHLTQPGEQGESADEDTAGKDQSSEPQKTGISWGKFGVNVLKGVTGFSLIAPFFDSTLSTGEKVWHGAKIVGVVAGVAGACVGAVALAPTILTTALVAKGMFYGGIALGAVGAMKTAVKISNYYEGKATASEVEESGETLGSSILAAMPLIGRIPFFKNYSNTKWISASASRMSGGAVKSEKTIISDVDEGIKALTKLQSEAAKAAQNGNYTAAKKIGKTAKTQKDAIDDMVVTIKTKELKAKSEEAGSQLAEITESVAKAKKLAAIRFSELSQKVESLIVLAEKAKKKACTTQVPKDSAIAAREAKILFEKVSEVIKNVKNKKILDKGKEIEDLYSQARQAAIKLDKNAEKFIDTPEVKTTVVQAASKPASNPTNKPTSKAPTKQIRASKPKNPPADDPASETTPE